MEEWQETYNWASSHPEDTQMDGEWWWNACMQNVLAQVFRGTKGIISKGEIKSATPVNQWKSALLTELYGILFEEHKLTIGQFKSALEKVKPEAAERKH